MFSKNILIELSRDGGVTYAPLGAIAALAKGSKEFTLNYTVTGPSTPIALIRASSTSSKGALTLVSPYFTISTPSVVVTPQLFAACIQNSHIADASITTSKIVDKAVTAPKIGSEAASDGFVLTADGIGGAHFYPLPSAASDLILPFGKTQNSASTLFHIVNSGAGGAIAGDRTSTTGSEPAVSGSTSSTEFGAVGVLGTVNSPAPGGLSAGVKGVIDGSTSSGVGVYGVHAGAGYAVYGYAPNGTGVVGTSVVGQGVMGTSSNDSGVVGVSDTVAGVYGRSTNGAGVQGTSQSFAAIMGIKYSTETGQAGYFSDMNASNTDNTLEVKSASLGRAGYFQITNSLNAANTVEVTTPGSGSAIFAARTANSGNAAAIRAESNSMDMNTSAILGVLNPTFPGNNTAGVRGISHGLSGLTAGVYGSCDGTGYGVQGQSDNGYALYGVSTNGYGAYAEAWTGTGVYGSSQSGTGVYGYSYSDSAVIGSSLNGTGVQGISGSGDSVAGVKNIAGTGRAGYFYNQNIVNASNVLEILTNGPGSAFSSQTTGTNHAGVFQISSAGSGVSALEVSTIGFGTAIHAAKGSSGVALASTPAVHGEGNVNTGVAGTSNSGNGVYGASTANTAIYGSSGGVGYGGVIGRNDVAGGFGVIGQSLGGATGVSGSSVSGIAGRFESTNAGNLSNTLLVNNSGTGFTANVQSTAAANGKGLRISTMANTGGNALYVADGTVAFSYQNGVAGGILDNAYILANVNLNIPIPSQDGTTVWVINTIAAPINVLNALGGAAAVNALNARQFIYINGLGWFAVQ